MKENEIIQLALEARTYNNALDLQHSIELTIGQRYERPLGDTCGNYGLTTGTGGTFNLKIIETATMMQVAVLESPAIP